MIKYFTEEIRFNLGQKRVITRWLKALASREGYSVGEINYIFCSDPYLLEINKQYLGHDYFTDIITFDYSNDYKEVYPDMALSGDIYISIDTVRANGVEYGEGFERELHRVLAHGLLHLMGYDDTQSSLSVKMREAENRALELLDGLTRPEIPDTSHA